MQKFAIVTGGSKGIGLAIVKRLLRENFTVITASRTTGELSLLKSLHGDNLQIHLVDLSIRSEIDVFSEKIKSLTDKIDLLVNNAGVFMPGQIHAEEDGNFETQMALNIAAPYHLTRAILPLMMPNRDGYIFNICSTASIMPYPDGGSYCISKHALLGFSKVLRQELIPFNIGVSAILPGATLTESWSGTTLPETRFMQPSSIANALWFAWEHKEDMVMEEILLRPMQGDI